MIDMDASDLKTEIIYIKEELQDAEKHVHNLKQTLKDLQHKLEQVCSHDEFIAEDNGDYHKPGYYYICKNCNLCLIRKPQDKKITYA
jgi:hypothetical protein